MVRKYLKQNKEMLLKKACKNHQNLSEEQKIKREYVHNRYRKLFTENEVNEEEKNWKTSISTQSI